MLLKISEFLANSFQNIILSFNRTEHLTRLPDPFGICISKTMGSKIMPFTSLWLGCNQLTMLLETRLVGNGTYTKLGALAGEPRAGFSPAVETKEIPYRPKCVLCKKRPGRRIVCRCGRRVGPCCWSNRGMCVKCASKEPEPEPEP